MSTDWPIDEEYFFQTPEDSDTFINFTTVDRPELESPVSVCSPVTSGGGIVSNQVYIYVETVVDLWVILVMSVLGVVTNILNIVVFSKQGFKDGVNISLASISAWDLIKCLGSVAHRLYGPVLLAQPALGTSWRNTTFPIMTYLPLFSGYVAYALATYVGVERCLSVVLPLKVRSLFTPKFTLIMDALISFVSFGLYSVMFFIYDVTYSYCSVYNTTIAIYVYSSFYYINGKHIMIYYKIIGLCFPVLCFSALCVSSAITINNLKRHTASLYRIQDSSFHASDSVRSTRGISLRERRVARMLVVVIIIYMVNIFPRIPVYIAALIQPEFYILKLYNNLFMTIIYVIYILDFCNASSSFFIFLKMSTNFRRTFYATFPCCRCRRR